MDFITRDITIGCLSHADPKDYYEIYTHPSMLLSITHETVPSSIAHAQAELKRHSQLQWTGEGIYWGIYKDGILIGMCGLYSWQLEDKTIELSYEVHPDHCGKGIATAATRYALRFAQNTFRVDRVICHTLFDNLASQRVAEKAGFRLIATIERDVYFNGSWRTRKKYEWRPPRTTT
ncbi:MAG: GNAT family N-acetyltransferase [Pseudomonadota bacterium]|nr:GNAT family N-acetyltransferase [Pseudomonadota bacterium]